MQIKFGKIKRKVKQSVNKQARYIFPYRYRH